jgi:Arginine-tRNA-protein transferase, C terminus
VQTGDDNPDEKDRLLHGFPGYGSFHIHYHLPTSEASGVCGGAAGEWKKKQEKKKEKSTEEKEEEIGRLVAVGVVDLLPEGLSSVYVFYDPDLPSLSLGRYTALAEVRWARDAMRTLDSVGSLVCLMCLALCSPHSLYIYSHKHTHTKRAQTHRHTPTHKNS